MRINKNASYKTPILKSNELSSFFGHINWYLHNYSYQKTCRLNKTVSFQTSFLSKENCKTILAVNAFFNHSQLSSFCSKKNLFLELIAKILFFLKIKETPEEILVKKLNKNLNEGFCHGISLELIRMSLSNPSLSPTEIMSQISTFNVGLNQVLYDLQAELEDRNQYRTYIKELVSSGQCPFENILAKQALFFDEELPSFLIQELSNQTLLNENLKQSEEFIKQINDDLLSSINYAHKDVFDFENQTLCKNFLGKIETKGCFIVSLLPNNGEETGHSLMLDLNNNRFFDQNAGFYSYPSKEVCLKAFFNRINQTYPSLASGRWKITQFIQRN